MPDYTADINVGQDISFAANVDLSAKQFSFILLNSSGKADLCTGAAGEGYVGVLQNDPTATQTASVRYGGVSKVLCNGSFSPGQFVTSDGNGKAILYTKATVFTGTPYIVSGTNIYGLAISAGAASAKAGIIVLHHGFGS